MSSLFGSALWGGGAGAPAQADGTVPVKKLIYMALRLAHVTKAPGIGPSPDQFADSLQAAQLMLDQARIRRPNIYTRQITNYVLGGDEIYTLGPGGTLVSTAGKSERPLMIERANLILGSTGKPVYLHVWNGTYEDLADRSIQLIPGALPRFLYCDYAAPASRLYLIPQDRGGDTLELYTWGQLPTLQTVDDRISLPPGYEDWFTQNLAVRLADVFAGEGAFVTEGTRAEALKATRAIQSRNTSSPRMGTDFPRGGRRGDFNYLSGDK